MIKTPHISAEEGSFAKTVLMPGDPLRSKFIAETFLENPVLVNNVRGMQSYTGTYKGKKVSVMASGMGIPTMAIFSYELFKYFGVENIIRVGTAGSIVEDLKIKDVFVADKAITNSNYPENMGFTEDIVCSDKLLKSCKNCAKELNMDLKVGTAVTSDLFYGQERFLDSFIENGGKVIEMETAALYINAKILNKNALAIYTVSDEILTNNHSSSEERQTNFTNMMKLALEVAIND